MPKIKLFVPIIALALCGCSASPTNSDVATVVASFYPIYGIALSVAQGSDGVEVRSMAENVSGCLHDYTLSSADIKSISASEIMLINGGGMESFIDDIEKNFPSAQITDCSRGARFMTEEEHSHEHHNHGDDENEKYHSKEGGDGEVNPHIWLSPENAITQAANIKKTFVAADPKNADIYENNFKKFAEECVKLQAELESIDLSGVRCISTHEGFPYIINAVKAENVMGIYTDDQYTPSAKELAHACEDVKLEGVSAILSADDDGLKYAELIANETGAKAYVLDPITSGENSADGYIKAMRRNIEVLKEVKLDNP